MYQILESAFPPDVCTLATRGSIKYTHDRDLLKTVSNKLQFFAEDQEYMHAFSLCFIIVWVKI